MIELTIAICPPNSERRIIVKAKIENMSGSRSNVQDYKYAFRCGSEEMHFPLTQVDASRGLAHVVALGLHSVENWVKRVAEEGKR